MRTLTGRISCSLWGEKPTLQAMANCVSAVFPQLTMVLIVLHMKLLRKQPRTGLSCP